MNYLAGWFHQARARQLLDSSCPKVPCWPQSSDSILASPQGQCRVVDEGWRCTSSPPSPSAKNYSTLQLSLRKYSPRQKTNSTLYSPAAHHDWQKQILLRHVRNLTQKIIVAWLARDQDRAEEVARGLAHGQDVQQSACTLAPD